MRQISKGELLVVGVMRWWGGGKDLVDSYFFFNDTATTEIYTLSLHDALPILACEVSSS